MTSGPTVSVVVPAYNAAEYVGAAISGVLGQTYPHVGVVVVDDGSSDDTAAIAEAYGDRVTVVRQVNGGPSSARNTGIAASESDYIAFCDADDIFMPGHVEQAVRAIVQGGERTWVASASWLLTNEGIVPRASNFYFGTPRPEQQVSAILAANFVPILSTVPRKMIDEVGGFDEKMVWCEDWDLWLRAILHGWRVSFVRERTALYRIRPESLSRQPRGMVEGHRTLLQNTLSAQADRMSPDEQRLVQERLDSPSYLELTPAAQEAVQVRDLRRAKHLYRQIARLNPQDQTAVRRAKLLRLYPESDQLWGRAVSASVDAVLNRAKPRTEPEVGRP